MQRVHTFRTLASLVGTALAARTAIQRIAQARTDGDRLEVLDAVVNALAVVTGIVVIVRRLRRGEAEA